MEAILKKFFGHSGFRPYQKEVIDKILKGRDCLVVMATGSGKSLCYQVPPLVAGKTGVVVSPLISLMQDQVMTLKQLGIKAEYLGSAQTDKSVQDKAQHGYFNLLFLTPEKACLLPVSFWSKLLEAGICLFAVDEAHCISEWGHDFRVDYKQLHNLRGILLDVPFVGLTATATEMVRADIVSSLSMRDPYVALGSFDRKNLFYGVKYFNHGSLFVDELVQEISKLVAGGGSIIIYCTTIKDVEQISKSLMEAGIKAGSYHGQMGNKAREESHRLFIRDELEVMVATVAFGMGIDKPNIRHVIHYGCPKSLESYYQESGRCGRDGISSDCWLYYTRSDFAKAEFYCGDIQTETQRRAIMESLMAAQRYCVLTTCRRKFLLSHFGEDYSASGCGNCDNCMAPRKEHDFSREALLLMTCIHSCKGIWGLNIPIDVLRGSRSKKILDAHFDKLPLHGLGKDYSSNWWKELAYQLISHGYLVETFTRLYRTVSVSSKGKQYLGSARPDHQPPLVLTMTSEMIKEREFQITSSDVGEFKSLATPEYDGFSKAESQLYHMLLQERMKLARGIGTAPYAICGDQTIKKIALARPSTKARLANIDGVNQHLVMKHGDHLLHVIRHLSKVLNLSLDGEVSMQDAVASNVDQVPSNKKQSTPAKFEAWRMWHKDGLSFDQIAKFPGRKTPIKEQTVMEYLLEYLVEAAHEGLEREWMRYCKEIGLTSGVFSDIQSAISKVGSTDKLKPIKNELPEDISYAHIKACLAMQNCKVSLELIQHGCHGMCRADELTSELSLKKESQELEKPVVGTVASCCFEDNKGTSLDAIIHEVESPNVHEELLSTVKRQRVDEPTILTPHVATESSILNWLKNYEEGVPLYDVLEHFGGSKEGSVIHLLSCLEADFMVFKKNGMYRLM